MIKIIDSSYVTQAILDNIIVSSKEEEINGAYTLNFSTIIDNNKSSYVNYQNRVETENDYFNIVYTQESRNRDSLYIRAQCEHVSYDLLSANFTAGFTATGLFSAVATTLLSGTGFSIGTVEITASETISVNESTNARSVLMQLAALYGGELNFNKYTIDLLSQRGADRGVQFRYRKNLIGVNRIVDNRTQIAGLPTISYDVDVAELEFEQGYIKNGYSDLEHYELGDTVKVIDEDLNLEISLRIVKESHDTEQRMQGSVELGNLIEDITHTIKNIQTTTVVKDKVYNGNSIGPENGFLSERSDELTQTYANATDGFTMRLRDTTTASFTKVFYVAYDTATGTANLYLVGNAVFQGTVNASDFIGGTIAIGTGSNVFMANGTDGIWLGSTAFSTASFKVNLNGALTAQNAQIIGDILAGSTFTVATGSNTIRADFNGLYVGSSAFTTAPFKSTLSGAVTATDITMTGNSTITGGTITGGTLRTAASGSDRIELSSGIFRGLTSSNLITGLYFNIGAVAGGTGIADIFLYHNNSPLLEFHDNITSYTIRPTSGAVSLIIGSTATGTYLVNTYVSGASNNLGSLSQSDSTATAIDTLVSDFNTLLSNLRSMKILT